MLTVKNLGPRKVFAILLGGCIVTTLLAGVFAVRTASAVKGIGPVDDQLVNAFLPWLILTIAGFAGIGVYFYRLLNQTEGEVAGLHGQLNAIDESQAMIEFKLDGTIVKANANFLKTLGYTLDEVVGKHHSMFVDSKYASSHEYRQFWSDLAAGRSQVSEFRRFGKNGKEVWIQASYNPIADTQGKPCKVVKFATDITAAKLANADSQGQLQAIGKAQAVIEFDLQGNIQNANENFLATVGYTLEEIKGKHHSMFVETAHANSHEYRNLWEELRAGRFQAGQFKRLGRGGKEIWIQATYNPIFDMNGRPFKVVKFATEVTALKLQTADYEGQLAAIDKAQATIEFNLDGTIRTANTNFLATLGYTLDEIKGKHHSIFVDTAYANSPEYRSFWDDLRAGKFQAAQYKRFGKGGKEVWIQASYNPIYDLNGRPFKVVKYATDITEAKRMEAEIAAAQKRDAQQAIDMQTKVNEILTVANKVAQRDYSQELTVCGSDVIGKLGEGLTKFFANKQETELREQQRADREREQAEELQRKVSVVLQIVNSVADGKFDVTIPNLGDDAIGQVASALQQAVNSMKAALGEVRDVSATVSSAAEQLTAVSREITAGAQTQASSLEETASSLEEITSTVKQNSDNAQQARQLANGSRDVAEKGGSVVSEAVQAMGEINQSSKKIADIITTIDEIAFQTNLLALNAAVEAARAGEQGRGFAVVAAEVRNLAQRSASAAKEIKALIQDSVRKVENGTDLVNKSGQTLSEIVSSVKRVTDIVSEIAAASREQLTGIEQVNKAVSQMDRVTQANASQTEEMSGTATSLLSHAVQLKDLVGRFQLDPESGRSSRTTIANRESASAKRSSTPSTHATHTPAPISFVPTPLENGVLEF
ncbi:MAG: methyl-accepting chemotaxis protein [Pirellulaceae bacterium]|nr:methyl-accepting chemotaxis protein [Pirellulaceae bacterium]